MTDPAITVSIPAYNEEERIAGAIETVQNQTLDDWELLIIDDGSTDATLAVVDEYRDDHRIRTLRHESNMGYPGARNTALRAARGSWHAFLGADDRLKPEALWVRYAAATDHAADLVHTQAIHINDSGDELGKRWDRNPPDGWTGERFMRRLFHRNFICIQSTLLRDGAIAGAEFDPDLPIACDHDFWLQLGSSGIETAYIGHPTVWKRRGDTLSNDPDRLYRERKRVAERAVKRDPWLRGELAKKRSSIELTYGLNLIGRGEVDAGRKHLRTALENRRTNWRAAAAYLASAAGPRPIRAMATEASQSVVN